jgi:hypothetical protein
MPTVDPATDPSTRTNLTPAGARRRGPARRLATAGAVMGLALAAVGLSACGSDDDATAADAATHPSTVAAHSEAPSTLDVTAHDYSFDLSSDTVAAGAVTMALTNDGVEPHQFHLARLDADTSSADLVRTFQEEGEPATFAAVEWAGGVGGVEPGATQQVTSVLEPGTYLLTCFLPTPGHHGTPHLMKGMVKELKVVAGHHRAELPKATTTVSLKDYAVELPAGFHGGPVEVRNEGKEHHELLIMHLKPGKGLGDIAAWQAAGSPAERPFEFAGGVGTLPPGASAVADLDLPAGDYVALCVVPGPGGTPHVDMGMVIPFTVA